MKTLSLFISLLLLLPGIAQGQAQIGSDIVGKNTGQEIGYSLALSADGQRMVVGSPGAASPEGHVRVYDLINGEWIQIGQDLGGRGMRNNVGLQVAITADGNQVAYTITTANDLPGQLRILSWDGQQWGQQTILEGPRSLDEEFFGTSMAMSADGRTIIVGNPFVRSSTGANAGGVTVFRLDGTWTDITGDFVQGGLNENIGFAVAITDDGNRIAFTSRDGTFEGSRNSGYTVVYDYDGSNWSQVGSTFGGNGEFGDAAALGLSLSMTPGGRRIAVGGLGRSQVGLYRVVEFRNGDWVTVGEQHLGERGGVFFGENILLSDDGDRLIMSDRLGGNEGGIYIENFVDGSWTLGPADLPSTEDDYGYTTAQAGNILAFSQPNAEVNGESVGVVKVFDISTLTSTRQPTLPLAKVWPNPTENHLNIAGVTFQEGAVLDIYGRTVKTLRSGATMINTAALPAGTYFLRLKTEAGWARGKFVRR